MCVFIHSQLLQEWTTHWVLEGQADPWAPVVPSPHGFPLAPEVNRKKIRNVRIVSFFLGFYLHLCFFNGGKKDRRETSPEGLGCL